MLDVGCGNGYYLSQLQSAFPQKSYVGVDLSRELIAEARTRHGGPALRFAEADYFAFSPARRFDLLLMRFIVQHLTDFATVLAQASRLIERGGGLLVVEPDLAASCNIPVTPRFRRAARALRGGAQGRRSNEGPPRRDRRHSREIRLARRWRSPRFHHDDAAD